MDFMADEKTEDGFFVSSMQKLRANPWIITTFFLAIALFVVLVLRIPASGNGGLTGNIVSQDVATSNLLTFVKAQVGEDAKLVSVTKDANFYDITVNLKGEDIPVLVTLDGQFLVAQAIPLNATGPGADANDAEDTAEAAPTEVPKSVKPEVNLFVMTYCPYGTQAEKGIISVLETLGTKINGTIRFVHYFMHGDDEEAETYTQVCLREEQKTKFLPYLKCFLNASDSAGCLESTGVDMTKLNKCLDTNKSKEYYAVDSALSQGYGVQGSPTLVINGAQSNAGRSSSSYLAGICGAFETAPSECSKNLSGASPSPGFGYAASDSATAASCG